LNEKDPVVIKEKKKS